MPSAQTVPCAVQIVAGPPSAPGQQAWLARPHRLPSHMPLLQVLRVPGQPSPPPPAPPPPPPKVGQHGWPGSPQRVHSSSTQPSPLPQPAKPGQHCWPSPPHTVHISSRQASPLAQLPAPPPPGPPPPCAGQHSWSCAPHDSRQVPPPNVPTQTPALQVRSAQHGSSAAPHSTQLFCPPCPPVHAAPAWQIWPGQQPWSGAPQPLQPLAMQLPLPEPQLAPGARQTSLTQQPPLHISPAQHCWPGPPHA
jgi:hypothetical protein